VGRCLLNSSGSGYGLRAGCSEHGNEPSGVVKGREYLDQLSNHHLLRRDCALWS
jgi:hypothetical protein